MSDEHTIKVARGGVVASINFSLGFLDDESKIKVANNMQDMMDHIVNYVLLLQAPLFMKSNPASPFISPVEEIIGQSELIINNDA